MRARKEEGMPDHAPLPPDGPARRACGIIYTQGADWEPPPIHSMQRGAAKKAGALLAGMAS